MGMSGWCLRVCCSVRMVSEGIWQCQNEENCGKDNVNVNGYDLNLSQYYGKMCHALSESESNFRCA